MAPAKSIPRLYAAASLKRDWRDTTENSCLCIPRLYAAASLKPSDLHL